jgi:hypothetical protein
MVVVAALVSGSHPAVAAAALLSLVCGFAATRIVATELAQSRRDAARDRAAQAHAYQLIYAERIAEHDRFATSMTEQIVERDGQIGRLLATVRHIGRRVDEAEDRAQREAARNAELQGSSTPPRGRSRSSPTPLRSGTAKRFRPSWTCSPGRSGSPPSQPTRATSAGPPERSLPAGRRPFVRPG